MKRFLAAVLFLFCIQPVLAIQSDSLYMALRPDSVRQIEVVLPDDAGTILPGKTEYTVRLEPVLQNESWADFSEQIVRTDENNTVIIPIHFSTFGRRIGECSEPFRLSISSFRTPERVIEGRVCASNYQDVDTGGGAGGIDGAELFDMKLNRRVRYGVAGERVNFSLMVQSHANLVVDLGVKGDIEGLLDRKAVYFDGRKRFKNVGLVFEPEREGRYEFEVIGRIRNCEGIFCQRSVKGRLIVKKELMEEAGFTVSLFPENINLKDLEPVDFRLTVVNNEGSKSFNVDVEMPGGLETNFRKRVLFVGGRSEETLRFKVTPDAPSKLYTITAVVEAGGVVKKAASYISTNEMLTDSLRGVERAKDKKEAGREVDSWYRKYRNEKYGEGLGNYSRLKDRLDELGGDGNRTAGNGKKGGGDGEGKPADVSVFIIAAVLMVLAAAGAGIYFFKLRGGEEVEGF
jgi:hypothetical protein